MRCCILLRVLAVFFLTFIAGQIVAFTTYQRPLPRPHDDPTAKLLYLQFALATRMGEYQAIMSEQLDNVSSNLTVISTHIDDSVANLFLLKEQAQNLPQAVLNDHFAVLADHFKLTGKDSKQEITNSLDNIKQSLTAKQNETEHLELFMQQLSDDVMLLQADILKDSSPNKEKSQSTSSTEESNDGLRYVNLLSPEWKDGEKILIQDIFKDYLRSAGVFPRAYSVIPEEHPDNTITRARYTVVFNATLPFDNQPCDYSCNSKVEIKFNVPVAHKDIGFEYLDVDMNCTASAPGHAKNALGVMGSGESLMAIWFEQAPPALSPEL